MNAFKNSIQKATTSLRKQITEELDTVITIGSGLGAIADELIVKQEIAYQDIVGLPPTTAPTHEAKLLVCEYAGLNIAICKGRLHLYEGYSAQQVAMLVYVLAALGAQRLIISNAAGALNANYRPGEVMLINDHINFTGQNPIIGQGDSLGQRFTDMSQAYNAEMTAQALSVASGRDLTIQQGVYAGVTGPSLETSAERRMFQQWGADAVGMSTVMEVIAANHCGMRVLGLSAITNMALGDPQQQPDTIEQVLHYAAIASETIKEIIMAVLTE